MESEKVQQTFQFGDPCRAASGLPARYLGDGLCVLLEKDALWRTLWVEGVMAGGEESPPALASSVAAIDDEDCDIARCAVARYCFNCVAGIDNWKPLTRKDGSQTFVFFGDLRAGRRDGKEERNG